MRNRMILFPAAAVVGMLGSGANAALVSTALTYSDMTLESAAAWSNGGGSDLDISVSANNTALSQSALATVTDFTPGTNFSVTGSFAVTAIGDFGSTTNRFAGFGITLFGDTTDPTSGIFASLVMSENRPSYDGGQRLHLGTNRVNGGGSYVGNFAVSGTAEAGETFLAGSEVQLSNGSTPTYLFTVSVTYDNRTQADISFAITDGTNTNTLTANNVDITSYASRNVFGLTLSERNRSLAGTFSDVTVNQIPEPASISLLLLGGAGLVRRRRS